MQSIKVCVDKLAALSKAMDDEDIIEKVLLGLDSEYNSIIESIHACDLPISFEELHEKLINRELTIKQFKPEPSLPATAFALHTKSRSHYPAHMRTKYPHHNYNNHSNAKPHAYSSHRSRPNKTQKPFLGKCQWCREQGHVLAVCPTCTTQFPSITPPPPNQSNFKPNANTASLTDIDGSTSWLLDSGASHHVTNDLNNLSLHALYDGTKKLLVGDGKGLFISHIDSMSFHSLKLTNILVVPALTNSIFSVSQLYRDNHISILFSLNSFFVKDTTSQKILFQGHPSHGTYSIRSASSSTLFSLRKASPLN